MSLKGVRLCGVQPACRGWPTLSGLQGRFDRALDAQVYVLDFGGLLAELRCVLGGEERLVLVDPACRLVGHGSEKNISRRHCKDCPLTPSGHTGDPTSNLRPGGAVMTLRYSASKLPVLP